MEQGRKVYTVSELNREIKTVLEDTYPDIWVEGEVSDLRIYSSGHTYFYLKDGEAQLSSVIFQGMSKAIKFSLEGGLKIIARGRVTAYPKRGDYQLIIGYAEPAGAGALQLAFEQLKKKLQEEGLFGGSRKRKLPLLPKKIGIVTSPDGAALRDILTVIERRYANVGILIYPVRVQGEEAKYEITEAIEYLNANHPEIDVLLVGRGGGSYEDLWAFNEEIVARAIYRSKIPVISCVGHEVDFTIADFVADLRAPTPSAAAELAVRDKQALSEMIEVYKRRFLSCIGSKLEACRERLDNLAESRVLEKPVGIFELKMQQLDELNGTLVNAAADVLNASTARLGHAVEKLNLVSPLNILSRGYSICVKQDDNRILKDSAGLKAGETIGVTLHKGGFDAEIIKVTHTESSR